MFSLIAIKAGVIPMQTQIKVTVCLENSLWVALFERVQEEKITAARVVFGKEPTDPELYEWLLANFNELKFSGPQDFKLIIKRKNPKRMLREVKREMDKAKGSLPKESLAQETLRHELEKRKIVQKSKTKAEKEALKEEQFLLKQHKKKKKQRGR
jgi:hypothetical protein